MGQLASSERVCATAQLAAASHARAIPSASAGPIGSLSVFPTEILSQIIALTYNFDTVTTLCLSLTSTSFLFLVRSLFGHFREEDQYFICSSGCNSWTGSRAILATEIQTALGRLRPRMALQGYDYASDLIYLVTQRSYCRCNDNERLHADYARARQLLCQDHPTPTAGPPLIFMMPQELIFKIISFSYDSDPVSSVCLALASHHFNRIVPLALNIAPRQLVQGHVTAWNASGGKKSFWSSYTCSSSSGMIQLGLGVPWIGG